MKKIFLIFFLLMELSVCAFSSEKWLAERGDDSDVERLRQAYQACIQKLETPAENVVVPLESYPNGALKSRITAARAYLIANTDFVWAEKICVEQFKQDGTRTAKLDAENCLVDRQSKSGWVEGRAQMVSGESRVKGRGIYFSLPREFIKIFSQSEIQTQPTHLDTGDLFK